MWKTGNNFAETWRLAKPFGCLIVVSVLIAGCTGYEKIPKQAVDKKYTLLGLNRQKGESTLVVLKAFKSDDRLAVCGSRTRSGGSDVHAQLEQQFFTRASVVIGEEEIGPIGFINQVSRSGLEIEENAAGYEVKQWPGKARCVRTKMPWNDSYRKKSIDFKGPERVRGRF